MAGLKAMLRRGHGSAHENLTQRTLRGLGWVYGGAALGAAMQLIYTAIMGRLLSPQDFGLLAMALVFERFGSYFASMGVSQALIQKPSLDEEDVRVAVTASLLLGAVFGVAVFAAAPLAGMFFETTAVVPIVRVFALAFSIGSFSQVSTSLMRRALRFGSLTAIDVTTQAIAFLGVGVSMASLGFGVWSLVGARLTHSVLQSGFSYAATRHAFKPLLRRDRLRGLYAYGSRISIISFFEFLGSNLDALLIGRFSGIRPLGHYNRAFLLVNLPFQQIVGGFSRVLFPAFSRIHDEQERLRGAYRSTYMILAGILLPTAGGLAIAAPEAVLVVLGEKWGVAGSVLPLLSVAAAISFLSHIGGVACDATASLNRKLVLQITHVLLIAGLLLAATRRDSLVTYAAAVLVAEIVRHLMYMFLMRSVVSFGPVAHLRILLPIIVSAGIVAAAVALATEVFRSILPVAGVFAAQVAAGALALAGSLLWGPMLGVRHEITARAEAAEILAGGGRLARAGQRLLLYGR